MTKAISVSTTPLASRRSLLAMTPLAAVAAAMPGTTLEQVSQHAELIDLCKRPIANRDAVNACPLDSDEDPYWPAYEQTLSAIMHATPKTMAGALAIAKIILLEEGDQYANGSPEETLGYWPFHSLKNIVSLAGGVA